MTAGRPLAGALVLCLPLVLTRAGILGAQGAPPPAAPALPGDFAARLVAAAVAQTTQRVRYDGSYRRIPYPGGDVPADVGVCTDVVVRAYRVLGIDLQQRVHEDMRRSFSAYPRLWGLPRPDPNIDHRRVPNLQAFLRRQGAELRAGDDPGAYRAGDLVTWMLPGNLPHIGLVADRRSADGLRPLIVHNIGRGPEVEDALFRYPVTGHYRYSGEGPWPRATPPSAASPRPRAGASGDGAGPSVRRVAFWHAGPRMERPRARSHEQVVARLGPRLRPGLRQAAEAAGVPYPPAALTLVGLKQERRLEVWARRGAGWRRLRDYPILAASGGPGPKLREGDRQVPEGAYRLTAFNPASSYHLSIRVDYPNEADRAAARGEGRTQLGGDIYIHGRDVSIGCLALGDPAIEELYLLLADVGLRNARLLLTPEAEPRPGAGAPGWLVRRYRELARELRAVRG
jgi:uncharacterized protein YijF (DUF1287 family)